MIGENNRTEANRNISVRMPDLLGIVGVRLVAGVDHRPRYCPCAGSLSRGLLTRSFHTDLDDAPRAKHHSARWPLPGIALHIAYAQNKGGQAMDRERLRIGAALLYVLLPILLLVAAPAVAQAPTSGKAKVDRLVMGLITPYLDYVRPWINGTADHNIQHDPMLEWLVEVDPSGQYKPWLADSWTQGPNARSWRVKLHRGVQFHHGYGEFTAQDVVHTHAL